MKYRFTDTQLAGNKKAKDCYALLDLLNETHHQKIKMTITRARGGHAHIREDRFTLPTYVFSRPEVYMFYYVIHEFTHCLGFWGHDLYFKRKEQDILQLFDIKIHYTKAYPKALYSNGQKVYGK